MLRRSLYAGIAIVSAASAVLLIAQKKDEGRNAPNTGYSDTPVIPKQTWKVHDISRPAPPMVAPAAKPGDPPADAIVLFDGKDLSKWQGASNGKLGDPKWTIKDGYMYATKDAGDLVSKDSFGDAQYHVEWSAPSVIDGASQWRGNSGFIIQKRYEIQVLDSWNNPTYADGQAASIYGQWPPMVNASRKPGEWQYYDIAWEAPKFEGNKMVKPPFVTVFHNGVLVHHHQELIGQMAHRDVKAFEPHPFEQPLTLQDHDTRTRFRNIWVRKLKGYDTK
ncbi:large, multifunctional secreted protein [Bryobacterales bacterium F-183]|nr:large, multifunctional secreted protein [Bryobacterales bacterium F-183]